MNSRGNTLVATLVTVAIVLVLMVVFFKGGNAFSTGPTKSPRADGKGQTTVGLATFAAKDDVCRSNLGQVRASLQIATSTNDDVFPASLEETRLGADFYRCPLGKEPYNYDAATGQVQCPHLGHEKY